MENAFKKLIKPFCFDFGAFLFDNIDNRWLYTVSP